MENKDYTLVQEICNGNEGMWEGLYQDAYWYVVRRSERTDQNKLLCRQDYREIADEAFALCYTQLERYEGRSSFAYWVSGYARNIRRNRCNRVRTACKYMRCLQNRYIYREQSNDPLQILLQREQNEQIRQALWHADWLGRAIVLDRVLREMSFRLIAQERRMERNDVISCYRRTLRALRVDIISSYNSAEMREL